MTEQHLLFMLFFLVGVLLGAVLGLAAPTPSGRKQRLALLRSRIIIEDVNKQLSKLITELGE